MKRLDIFAPESDFIWMKYPLDVKLKCKVEVACEVSGNVQIKDMEFDNLHDYMQYNLHEYGPFHPCSKPKDRQLLKGLHFKFSEQNPKILEKLIKTHGQRIVTRGGYDFRYGSGSIDIGDAITRIRDTKLGFVNRPFHNW